MSKLSIHLDDYLKLRRQLGFKLKSAGMTLRNFVRFAEKEHVSVITAKPGIAMGDGAVKNQSRQTCQPIGHGASFRGILERN